MKHEQLFAEFNVSAARNLSLSSEAKDESMEVARLRTRVSSLEAIEGSLRGEVTTLESIIAEKDHELSDMGTSASSLRSQNQSLVNQVHELETSFTGLREKLEMYEGSIKQLDEFQDNLMKPLEARLAEIDADFTRCCMHFQENFHPYLLNAIAGRRWLLTYGMKLLMAKCLNSTEYMEARGNAFGRTIKKGIQEGLAAGIEHGQAEDPPVTTLITTALSTVVIRTNSDPFLLVTDYENPDLAGAVPEDVISGPEGEGKVEGSTKGDVDDVFSQLENEARDVVL
ncbi:hypothetical protein Tco_0541152 [Tanacetum coccineum]